MREFVLVHRADVMRDMSHMILLALLAALMSLAMALAWAVARKPGKSGWTDTIWSYAAGAGGVIAALAATGPLHRRLLVAAMIGAWSLRLGTHILKRTLKGIDDPRYAALRKEWGAGWEKRLFRFLQIQALAAFLLILTVLAAASNTDPFPAWSDYAALLVFAAAIGGETIADRQLKLFAANPANRGQVMDQGLWAWSRHPNYFFEWLLWWSFVLVAIGPGFALGWRWIALLGPALIYWLLVYASGIPPTEAHMLRSRGDAFRRYQQRVNAFFPGPPRT